MIERGSAMDSGNHQGASGIRQLVGDFPRQGGHRRRQAGDGRGIRIQQVRHGKAQTGDVLQVRRGTRAWPIASTSVL